VIHYGPSFGAKAGGVALRIAFLADPFKWSLSKPAPGEDAKVMLKSAIGEHVITMAMMSDELDRLRVTVRFKPSVRLLMPFMPRDLYPFDEADDPLGARAPSKLGSAGCTRASSISVLTSRPSVTCSTSRISPQ